MHGVTQITGGHREMFSNEMWYNPDLPLGTTLWTSNGMNMEDYIQKCNQEEEERAKTEGRKPDYGAHECTVPFSDETTHGVKMTEVRDKYGENGNANGNEKGEKHGATASGKKTIRLPIADSDSEDDEEYFDSEDDSEDDEDRARREYFQARHRAVTSERRRREQLKEEEDMEDDFAYFAPPNDRYMSEKEQPNFLIPQKLGPGQMAPLYFRDTEERLEDDEAYVIGLPPELLQEFTKYMDNNGMLETAKKLAYETERSDKEHELYTLNDGRKWGVMHPKWSGNDMVWIDPGDEECFESLMDVLRKGNFDTVLDAIGD